MSDQPDLNELLADVIDLVKGGGDMLKNKFGNEPGKEKTILYQGEDDLVTVMDETIELKMYKFLSEKYPWLGFFLEEHPELNTKDKDYIIYIDPIDGTKYFSKDVPLFSVSAGVLYKGDPVLGVVYNPTSDQLYTSIDGQQTQLNGHDVKISEIKELSGAIIIADLSTRKRSWESFQQYNDRMDWMSRVISDLNHMTKRTRMLGSGALSTSWVASGGIDAFVSLGGHEDKPFDIAAGKALVKYAGGVVVDIDIPNIGPRTIMGNQSLVDQIASILMG